MSDRPVLEPTAEHPITVEPTGRHVTVRVNGEIVADTDRALTLRESTYPAVQYIPHNDVIQDKLRPSDTQTYCPFKGDASYYDLVTGSGAVVEDAIWTYEKPYPAVAPIAGHVAFYPDKAEVTVVHA
ncbi:hypothetical protein AU189_03600 [Mycolicibacterium acapulense]|uniref:DUF427 domain-containing protein n=1 Tax=Mycobacterium TaxID=1763 RepID=UPI00074915D5|nr:MULTISPECIES: DUF427 domain-containing protein [Mycobacterium]KUI05462.1 hypothetical protein AU189_03600 [Mycolicibacterium acapulense]KUI15231.1 hypothetical protein AU191_01820 [Mycolicibacterium acapulense]OBB75022.1 hypothetical protein A5759_09905 [Mycobacterium sp. 852014-52144_SCH5372336]OBF95917.1 hypothetical protein A5790_06790 [Mycobacterium sp. 852002-51152_SCH6134967]